MLRTATQIHLLPLLAFTRPCESLVKKKYSSAPSQPPFLRPRNWHIQGLPPPQSLVHYGEVDLRKRKRYGYAQPLENEEDNSMEHNYAARQGAYNRPTIPDDKVYEIRAHRAAMKRSFPEGWAPPRRLSREAMEGLRTLHAHDPETFTTPVLADRFRISPEAVRRILKSAWEPTPDARKRMLQREAKAKAEVVERKKAEARVAENKGKEKDRLTLV